METYLGTVMPFPYGFVPEGWAACNGQTLLISLNTALFSLLGTNFGGDGVNNFSLPNLNGGNGAVPMVAAGQGQGPGLSPRYIGDTFGSQTMTLLSDQIPAHSHGLGLYRAGVTPTAVPAAGNTLLAPATNAYVATPAPMTTLAPATVMAAGMNGPHDNAQPTLDLVFCIRVSGGLYPTFGN